ncbi:uncharacterized protein AKAME5_002300700 [Lates japonicus]|uniref:TNFR-Cys domain-containing protein n=1 Tax=Lates japonicus TaxID=270547 RepID=A0AAD3RKW1_LATJO|nr:uncharacterized protein AKAME5_002300700 [Lates japonicus]
MTFEPGCAGPCPCREGYFVIQNCTVNPNGGTGVRCRPCTDCSAAHQDTLVKCSMFADSVCGNRTISTVAPTVTLTVALTETPAVSAPEEWVILTVILVSVFLILLLSLFVVLLSCQNQPGNKHEGLDLL